MKSAHSCKQSAIIVIGVRLQFLQRKCAHGPIASFARNNDTQKVTAFIIVRCIMTVRVAYTLGDLHTYLDQSSGDC